MVKKIKKSASKTKGKNPAKKTALAKPSIAKPLVAKSGMVKPSVSKPVKPEIKFQDKGCPKIVYVMFFFVILILAISVYQYTKVPAPEIKIIQPELGINAEPKKEVLPIEEPLPSVTQPSAELPVILQEKEIIPKEEMPAIKKEYTIILKDRKFDPSDMIIPWGSTVTFINNDDIAHTIMGRTRPYDSTRAIHLEPMKPGQRSSFLFQRTGDYEIFSGTIASIKMYITVN